MANKFHQYQHSEQSPPILAYWAQKETVAYNVNTGPGLG